MNVLEKLEIVQFNRQQHGFLIDELTEMLHNSYRPLALQGMKYLATHQSPEITMERLENGDSFLGFIDEELISTITLVKDTPYEQCKWYLKTGVYFFTQFAVKTNYQGLGVGQKLMDFVEEYAISDGALEMALDTSEHAHGLIKMYKKRNYRLVEYTHWGVTNYRSVVLSKNLSQ